MQIEELEEFIIELTNEIDADRVSVFYDSTSDEPNIKGPGIHVSKNGHKRWYVFEDDEKSLSVFDFVEDIRSDYEDILSEN